MHLDTNSPYGLAISQYLPTGGFKWLNDYHTENTSICRNVHSRFVKNRDVRFSL